MLISNNYATKLRKVKVGFIALAGALIATASAMSYGEVCTFNLEVYNSSGHTIKNVGMNIIYKYDPFRFKSIFSRPYTIKKGEHKLFSAADPVVCGEFLVSVTTLGQRNGGKTISDYIPNYNDTHSVINQPGETINALIRPTCSTKRDSATGSYLCTVKWNWL